MPIDLTQAGRPADSLVATLHNLEFGSANPALLADYFGRALNCSVSQLGDAFVAQAPDRCLVFTSGQPRTLRSAGFAVRDARELAALRGRIGRAGVAAEDGPTRLFSDAVTVRDPDGNVFAFGLPAGAGPKAGGGPEARLQHVVVASRNPAAIVRFFVHVLGFTLSDDVLDEDGGVRTSFLRCSQEHHSFAVFLGTEDRLDHHCYETSSWNEIRDWADHMAEARIPVKWGPGRHGPGNNLFMFIHDPDGNWIELSAELEIVEHDRPAGQWLHEERTFNSWGEALLRI